MNTNWPQAGAAMRAMQSFDDQLLNEQEAQAPQVRLRIESFTIVWAFTIVRQLSTHRGEGLPIAGTPDLQLCEHLQLCRQLSTHRGEGLPIAGTPDLQLCEHLQLCRQLPTYRGEGLCIAGTPDLQLCGNLQLC